MHALSIIYHPLYIGHLSIITRDSRYCCSAS